MHRVDRITLTFEDNGRLHGDLVLHIGDAQWRCDSYFLWCEDVRPNLDHVPIVRRVLAKLIEQWAASIRTLEPKHFCFLPYDFSDQSTGWLRCNLVGDDLVVQHGWSTVEGWSFAPSDVGKLMTNLPDFKSEGSPVTISRESMLRSLGGVTAIE